MIERRLNWPSGAIVTPEQEQRHKWIDSTISHWTILGEEQFDDWILAVLHRDHLLRRWSALTERKLDLDQMLQLKIKLEAVLINRIEPLWERCQF